MAILDPATLLQGFAAVTWAGAAAAARAGSRATGADQTLAAGLLVGALLLGIDTLTGVGGALPLAGAALALSGALALLPGPGTGFALLRDCPWRRSLAMLATFLLLHALHGELPRQPVADLGVLLRPFDLAVGLTLLWLALRSAPGDHAGSNLSLARWQQHLLFGGSAAGLCGGAVAAGPADAMVAGGAVFASAALLGPALRRDGRAVPAALAAGLAAVVALGLRAHLLGGAPAGGWLADGLLLLAVLFAAFGAAVVAGDREVHAPAPATTPEPARSGQPAALPQPATAPVPADVAAPLAPEAPEAPSGFSLHHLATDLRTPLTSMLVAADLLADATDPGERNQHLATILEQGTRLAAHLADLEDYERVLLRRLEFADDTFCLADLLRDVAAAAAPAALARCIAIRLDVAADLPPWLEGDATRVRQLATRMLDGAIARSTVGPVDLAASATDDRLHVVVQNACPSAQTHDLGGNAHRSIGLAFCRQLASAMGGRLDTTAHEHGGFTFYLQLPLRIASAWEAEIAEQDAIRPLEIETATAPARLAGLVLVVDDDRNHRRLLSHLLDHAGATVVSADSGEVALHLLQQQSFDLVLLDLQMPGMDGFATVQELRRRDLTTPVVAVTADGGEATLQRCLAAGCNGQLEKPVQHDRLLRTLGMYLSAPANG